MWTESKLTLLFDVCDEHGHTVLDGWDRCPICDLHPPYGEMERVNLITKHYIVPTVVDFYFRRDPLIELLRKEREAR